MKPSLLPALAAILMLGACEAIGNSRANPFNWFGGNQEAGGNQEQAADATARPAPATDPRPLVAEISALRLDKAPGGVIIHATGLPPTQGYWQAALVATNDGLPQNGELLLELRARPPLSQAATGTPASREISAARFLSDQSLEGVSTITVRAAQNARSARR
ncbi:MAG: hypothetical protein SWN98_04340 [Pseudomonadota bacterium]|nr:hypothetical protein [Pseudomonadota bacterium]